MDAFSVPAIAPARFTSSCEERRSRGERVTQIDAAVSRARNRRYLELGKGRCQPQAHCLKREPLSSVLVRFAHNRLAQVGIFQ
jgi:hypothetical protein